MRQLNAPEEKEADPVMVQYPVLSDLPIVI